ncbi:MAG: alpha glucosidase [Rhodospirillales bacterium]|nr:alpha glucosidase [Rhodospirillales bacterium]
MTKREWWRGAVVYHIYPRSFFDSDGDGVGDLAGIAQKLDHVAALGVDAIWLSPFFTSPMRDFGYDVADYCAVDPTFGTLADFDRLLERAHALGLKVLIDAVWSHTSDQHAWFRESRADRSNPKADWYVWANARPDGTPPNNWLSVFGGSAWTWEPRRRQYYLHHFLSSQPTLNLRHPEVVEALMQVGRFWLDRGVDGFRLDAIDFFMHDPLLRDNPPKPPPNGIVPAKPFGLQEHRYDMLHEDSFAFLRRVRDLVDAYPDRVTLGEVSSQDGAFERVAAYTRGHDLLHMAYTLRPLRGDFDHATLRQLIAESAATGEEGWICWSFSNHDVERAVSRWSPKRGSGAPDPAFARLLMALLLSLRGSACVYQGEELGLTEADLAFEHLRDPFGITYWPEFRGRDGSRTPIPWVAGEPHAGFTRHAAPWLPVPEEHHQSAVERQEADPGSLLNAWRRFIRWRRGRKALVEGALRPFDLTEPLIGFERVAGAERIACIFNLSDGEARLPSRGLAPLEGHGFEARREDDAFVLPPHGVLFAAVSQTEALRRAPVLERVS